MGHAGRPRLFWWGIAALLVAGVLGSVLLGFTGGGSANAPDTGLATLEGRTTGQELPAPLTVDECSSALRNFPGITAPAARSAFVSACFSAHGPDGGAGGGGLTTGS
ncbi:MAG TPA: hypothetical protein VNG13_01290 [Mycobacteriales bacterium]|nr:hypothetical protein [Mycobacteriales bacterium]